MTGFEYLMALISVVAGLGLTRALSGMAQVVHMKSHVELSWIHFVWTASIVFWLISFWWFNFLLSSLEGWSVSLLLFILLYGSVIYFLIALLYPETYTPGADLLAHFIENRQLFFGTFLVLWLMDVADTSIKTAFYSVPSPDWVIYIPFMIIWLAVGITGLLSKRSFTQKVIAVVWLVVVGPWAVLSNLSISL